MKTANVIRTTMLSTLLASSMALAQSGTVDRGFSGDAEDAWITGKIETVLMLNTALNSFAIDTDVENGVATLSGQVESQIDKDLAGELARDIEGVSQLHNNLTIDPAGTNRYAVTDTGTTAGSANSVDRTTTTAGERNISQRVSDATITAVVKSKLLANDISEGLEINVDTSNNVVTLTGKVRTPAEKQLAEEIALDGGDVHHVENNLTIDPAA